MSTVEAAAQIRKQLKAEGWSSRDVSVRSDLYSMGSTIRVLIKNAAVPMALVKRIAEPFERVHRCESTGEILSGANRYLDVEYSRELMKALSAPVAAVIPEDGSTAEIEGWRVHRTGEPGEYYCASRPGCRTIRCWGREFCAQQIVQENLALAAKPRVHVKAVCVEVEA